MPFVRRYSRFKRKRYTPVRSRSYAARVVQGAFRKRRRTFARRVNRVIRNQEPIRYSINDPSSNNEKWKLSPYGGAPLSSATNAIETIGIIPYAATPSTVGSRQSRKVFLQNLNFTFAVQNTRAYSAGAQPLILRLAVLEARACDIRSSEVLIDLANVGASAQTGCSVTHPYNHKKVKVLKTWNMTVGDSGGYGDQGYRSTIDFKHNIKLNRLSVYENKDPALTTDQPIKKNLYLWACCPGAIQPAPGTSQMTVYAFTTLSFKALD